ncbi:MAG TPA: alpha/beta hydrolase [Gemmatimonadales bacterium]
MSQSPFRFPSRSPFARSHPAAVALLVLLAALSAREHPPTGETGWPEVAAVEQEAATTAAVTTEAGLTSVPATMVRTASGEVVDVDPAAGGVPELGEADGYPHPVEYLTVEIDGEPVPLAFMDVSPTGPVNGRAVLILHDRGEAGDEWAPTIAALAGDGYRVLVPDQVGHGLSGRLAAEPPVEMLAAQAMVLLDSLGAPRVSVVGDGLGADVAVRLASAYPGQVERMVLLAGESVAAPERAVLHDPVRGRRLPVLVVAGEERIDPLLLGFLGL